jgi:hypothetical protein
VKRGRIGGRGLFGIGAATLAILALMAGIAAAAASIPDDEGFVEVASGHRDGVSWAVGMRRHGRQRCYEIASDRNEFSGYGSVCGRRGVEGDWSRVYGDGGEPDETALELNLTSPRVRTLRLTVHRIGAGTRQRSFHPKLLSKRQSQLSGLPRDFRFVVIVEPREFCVEGVEALTQGGTVVADEAVPCEG